MKKLKKASPTSPTMTRVLAEAKRLRQRIAPLARQLRALNEVIRVDKNKKYAAEIKANRRRREKEWLARYALRNGVSVREARKLIQAEQAAFRKEQEAARRAQAEIARRMDVAKVRAAEGELYERYKSGALGFDAYEASIASLNERIKAGEFDRKLH
jgi:folate-binding Fe-S cluster repair protein YgfZ